MQTQVPEKIKVAPLNIRLQTEQRYLIEQAAQQQAKTVSDFVRETVLQESQRVLLDRTHFVLNEQQWNDFNQALDNFEPNKGLQDLLSRKPVWDKK